MFKIKNSRKTHFQNSEHLKQLLCFLTMSPTFSLKCMIVIYSEKDARYEDALNRDCKKLWQRVKLLIKCLLILKYHGQIIMDSFNNIKMLWLRVHMLFNCSTIINKFNRTTKIIHQALPSIWQLTMRNHKMFLIVS